jgi:hypothetical protein
MTSDGAFFYANLIPVNSPGQAEFIFGGQPVNQSFYAPTSNNRFFAFNLQPDAALQSPIPFVGLVSSSTVSNGLLPSGLCSTCQFLQWGYWTGVLDTPNAAGTAPVRQDAAHIILGSRACRVLPCQRLASVHSAATRLAQW